MSFSDFIGGLGTGLGNLANGIGNGLLPPQDPNTQGLVDPATAAAIRNASLIKLGLGIRSAPYDMAGTSHGLLDALNGASQDYSGAMDSAFKHTLMKRAADAAQEDRAFNLSQRQHDLDVQKANDAAQSSQFAADVLRAQPQTGFGVPAAAPGAPPSPPIGQPGPAFGGGAPLFDPATGAYPSGQTAAPTNVTAPAVMSAARDRVVQATAGQVTQGAQNAQNSGGSFPQYFGLVKNDPRVQFLLSHTGLQAPDANASPQDWQAFQGQLATVAKLGAPTAPIKLDAGQGLWTVGPDGQPRQIASQEPKLTDKFELVKDRTVGPGLVQDFNLNKQTGELAPVGKPHAPSSAGDPNSVEQTAQMIANGQIPMLTGFALKTPWGQQVVARVGQLNPTYNAQDFHTGQQTLTAFSKGKQGDTVRSLNVAVQHLDTLSTLSDALGNGNFPLVNKIANTWSTQTGGAAPTTFDAAKKIVADEVVKAVVGSGGGVADREKAENAVNAANSPAALKGVISTYQQLMGGQLTGLQKQYEQGTGRKDFTRFLTPRTMQVLGHGATAPGAVTQIKSDADFDALPSGAHFVGPDGQQRVKP